MSDMLLSVQELTKVFYIGQGFSREKLVAVNQVNFDLEMQRPEIFTVAGESGSGKTTVANMLLTFEEPTSGKILYKGNDISRIQGYENRMRFMHEIQAVFQNAFATFNPLKKVDTYLFETERNFKVSNNGGGRHEMIEQSLNLVGLTLKDVRGKYPNEFSGGQLQRISIARALITSPSLLIADEPVSMVDASLRMSIVNLFKDLKEQRGVSVIYITHDLATAYYVSDRIAIMLRGNIVEMGTVEKVLVDPLHPYTKILKESVPEPDPDKKWEKEVAFTDLETKEYSLQGCKFAGRCPAVMDVCRNIDPDLRVADGRAVKCHLYSA
ncbi:MAG: ABC transporter ATP-binding protein [bacterium]|nr:ABC transporter ATP-binding protein [bacterium]